MTHRLTPLFAQHLLAWYDTNKRNLPWRRLPSPYHIWISEIMLQQTQVTTVIPYFERFIETYPDVPTLAQANRTALHKHWEGLGYYSRADNLKKAAEHIMDVHQGNLPADYAQLLQLPGIGPYTAGAIASMAFGLRHAAVDGNVLRVFSRLLAFDEPINEHAGKKTLTAHAEEAVPETRPGDFNQALMDLGATICVASGQPRCDRCPVAQFCLAREIDIVDVLPKKTPRKARRKENRTIVVLTCKNRVWIRKRPRHGLLAGLWEFLNLPGKLEANNIPEQLTAAEGDVLAVESLGSAKHLFTHLEWHMNGYLVTLTRETDFGEGRWVDQQELAHTYALPKAIHVFRNALLYPA